MGLKCLQDWEHLECESSASELQNEKGRNRHGILITRETAINRQIKELLQSLFIKENKDGRRGPKNEKKNDQGLKIQKKREEFVDIVTNVH